MSVSGKGQPPSIFISYRIADTLPLSDRLAVDLGVKVASLQRSATRRLKVISCKRSRKTFVLCLNKPENGHFWASFAVEKASNANSSVAYVGNPSIIFGQVAVFLVFLLDSLFLRCSRDRMALRCSDATFTPRIAKVAIIVL